MGLVSVWTGLVDLVPYAWFASLLCGLLFIELLQHAQSLPSRRRYLMAGVAFGAVGCFRHDLFAYFAVATMVAWAQPRFVCQRLGYARPARRGFLWLLAGAAMALGLVWLPTVALAGLAAPLRDLVIEQARYVQPARGLPMPHLMAIDSDTHMPVFMLHDFEGAIVMTGAGPALAAVLALGRRWLRIRSSAAVVLVGLLSAAVMPQMLHRTDIYHTFFTVTPALVLAAALVETLTFRVRLAPAKVVIAGALLWVFVRPVQQVFLAAPSFAHDRDAGQPEPAQQLSPRVLRMGRRPGSPAARGVAIHRETHGAGRAGLLRYAEPRIRGGQRGRLVLLGGPTAGGALHAVRSEPGDAPRGPAGDDCLPRAVPRTGRRSILSVRREPQPASAYTARRLPLHSVQARRKPRRLHDFGARGVTLLSRHRLSAVVPGPMRVGSVPSRHQVDNRFSMAT